MRKRRRRSTRITWICSKFEFLIPWWVLSFKHSINPKVLHLCLGREQVELDPRRCKTSLVGQSTGLSVPRSPVRFQQKLQKSRSQIYTWAHRASNKATRLFKQHWSILTSRGSWGGGVQGHFWPCHGQKIRSKSITFEFPPDFFNLMFWN